MSSQSKGRINGERGFRVGDIVEGYGSKCIGRVVGVPNSHILHIIWISEIHSSAYRPWYGTWYGTASLFTVLVPAEDIEQ